MGQYQQWMFWPLSCANIWPKYSLAQKTVTTNEITYLIPPISNYLDDIGGCTVHCRKFYCCLPSWKPGGAYVPHICCEYMCVPLWGSTLSSQNPFVFLSTITISWSLYLSELHSLHPTLSHSLYAITQSTSLPPSHPEETSHTVILLYVNSFLSRGSVWLTQAS